VGLRVRAHASHQNRRLRQHRYVIRPAKVARLVLAAAELEDPPLRILAGSDGYQYAPAREQPPRHSGLTEPDRAKT
jgi:hypothetical protein